MVIRQVDETAVAAAAKAVSDAMREIKDVQGTIGPILGGLSGSIRDGHTNNVESGMRDLSGKLERIENDLSNCKNKLDKFAEKIQAYVDLAKNSYVNQSCTTNSATSNSTYWNRFLKNTRRFAAILSIPFVMTATWVETNRDMSAEKQITPATVMEVVMGDEYDWNEPVGDMIILISDMIGEVAENRRRRDETRRRMESAEVFSFQITTLHPDP